MSSDQPNMNDLRMFCHAVDSRMTDNDLLVGLRSLTGLTARIDELEAQSRLRWLSEMDERQQVRIDELEAEKEELKDQAADDIIWMSGIGPIPDAGLAAWSGIQERWLQ